MNDIYNQIKNKKYRTLRTVPQSNGKIVGKCKCDTPNTPSTDTSVKSGGLDYWYAPCQEMSNVIFTNTYIHR